MIGTSGILDVIQMDKTEKSRTDDHILTKSMCVRLNAKLNYFSWVSSRFSIWSRKV